MLITDFIPIGLFAFVAASLLVILFHSEKLRADRKGVLRLFLLRFSGLWWTITAIALLFKIRTFMRYEYGNPLAALNLMPFKTIVQYFGQRNWVQLAGNVFIFFPFPILLYFNFPKMKNRAFLLTVLCVTVLIEPVQLLINIIARTPYNVIDVDDFLLNVAGCLLGLSSSMLLKRIAQRKKVA